MRKIKMLTTAAGPNGVYIAGQVVTVDDDTAKAFIAGGYAEAVSEPKPETPVVETTTAEPPENAMKRPPKRRKAGK